MTWLHRLMLLTAIAQEGSKPRHAKQGSIKRLRALLALNERMPPPAHLLYAPVSIAVKRRDLKAPLDEADAEETGERKIEAEWIVHDAVKDDLSETVVLYIHGGAYYSMSIATHRPLCLSMSKALRCRLLSVAYRLAPESPYPAALIDVLAAYHHLLEAGIAPSNIIVSGDSAGGGLSMALLLAIRDQGLSQPGGAILLSPWVDLTTDCATWDENAQFDYLTRPVEGSNTHPRTAYLGDRSAIQNYYASPLFAPSFDNLPPILIHAGAMECLRDEAILLASRIGSQAQLCLFDHQVHVFQFFVGTPPAQASLRNMATFASSLPLSPCSFSFAELDASMQRLVPESKEPKRKAVAPPRWSFDPRLSARPPQPKAREDASGEMKAIVDGHRDPEPYTFFAPRRLLPPPTIIESATSLLHL